MVQKELPHHNKNFTKEQEDFIYEWCKHREKMDKLPKYEGKIIKYDFTQNVLKGVA